MNTPTTIYKTITVVLLTAMLSACHSPIYNRHDVFFYSVESWNGVSVRELLQLKGKPSKIIFMGNTELALISSEFWTPELSRYELLYINHRTIVGHSSRLHDIDALNKIAGNEPVWTLIFNIPVASIKKGLRECTEYYQLNPSGIIIKAGSSTTSFDDGHYCRPIMPYISRPRLGDFSIR